MEDFSFKSLAVTGMLMGVAFWGGKNMFQSKDVERLPTASAKDSKKVQVKESYRPSLGEFSQEREEVVSVNDEGALPVEGEGASPAAEAGDSADFAQTRLEITRSLAQGDVDQALTMAERKLAESLRSTASEMAYIGYLHEFILQNAEDPETEYSVTVAALKDAQSPNVRKFLYEKFQNYSPPEAMERLDGEMDAMGIQIQ